MHPHHEAQFGAQGPRGADEWHRIRQLSLGIKGGGVRSPRRREGTPAPTRGRGTASDEGSKREPSGKGPSTPRGECLSSLSLSSSSEGRCPSPRTPGPADSVVICIQLVVKQNNRLFLLPTLCLEPNDRIRRLSQTLHLELRSDGREGRGERETGRGRVVTQSRVSGAVMLARSPHPHSTSADALPSGAHPPRCPEPHHLRPSRERLCVFLHPVVLTLAT